MNKKDIIKLINSSNDILVDEIINNNNQFKITISGNKKMADSKTKINNSEIMTILLNIQESVNTLKEDMVLVKEDVNTLKEDMVLVKEDINTLKEDINTLKEDIKLIKSLPIIKKELLELNNK